MASPEHVVHVNVEPVDYEFGSWCRTCLLPSGVHIVAVVTVSGRSSIGEFDRCVDCGGDQVDPPEA